MSDEEAPADDEPRIKYLGRMLINTDDWWLAIDGRRYNTVWGPVWAVVAKDVLGITPGGGHAAFVLQVGRTNPIIIAGCRVHYAQLCEERPTMLPDALIIDEPAP